MTDPGRALNILAAAGLTVMTRETMSDWVQTRGHIASCCNCPNEGDEDYDGKWLDGQWWCAECLKAKLEERLEEDFEEEQARINRGNARLFRKLTGERLMGKYGEPWTADITDAPYEELPEAWAVDCEDGSVCVFDGPKDANEDRAKRTAACVNFCVGHDLPQGPDAPTLADLLVRFREVNDSFNLARMTMDKESRDLAGQIAEDNRKFLLQFPKTAPEGK